MTMLEIVMYITRHGYGIRVSNYAKNMYQLTLIDKTGFEETYTYGYIPENIRRPDIQRRTIDDMICNFREKSAKNRLNSLYGTGMYDEYIRYLRADIEYPKSLCGMQIPHLTGSRYGVNIKKVIFNDPATIVFWMDGTKTVVKAHNEPFDKEKGLAMAITKKFFGNEGNYYNKIKKWLE